MAGKTACHWFHNYVSMHSFWQLFVLLARRWFVHILSDMGFSVTSKPTSNVAWKCVCISSAASMVSLIAACWPGYLRLTDLAYCKNCRQAYSRLLAWLIVAYWPGCLCLNNQAYCLLLDWLIVAGLVNCSLLIGLTELAYCGLLA